MTHDELLAMIDKQDHAIQIGGIGSEIEVLRLMGFRNALRAVVELHRQDFGTPSEDVVCDWCKVIYPCPTIQAIEKELK